MSVPELAERSGATVADIEKLERGEEVESQTAKAVLTALDVDLSIIEEYRRRYSITSCQITTEK